MHFGPSQDKASIPVLVQVARVAAQTVRISVNFLEAWTLINPTHQT